MLIGLAVAWGMLIIIVLLAWARLQAATRAAEGIDELLHAHGLDEDSRNEAA